jgi:hypothetical protein
LDARPESGADLAPQPTLSRLENLVDEGGAERTGQSDPEYDRETADLVFQGHSLADQFLASDDQRADRVGRQRLHMHGLTSQMRQASRVVAIGLAGS